MTGPFRKDERSDDEIGAEELLFCRYLEEATHVVEYSDQPNQYGPCPICRNEECKWGFFAWADLEREGHLLVDMPTIRISNRGDDRNCAILVEGQWSDEVIESHRQAALVMEEDA